MAVSDDQNIADLTLARSRGLRRENTAMLEQLVRLSERQNRPTTTLIGLQEEVRDTFGLVRADINSVKSDVLLLEGQNASRHGEILNVVPMVGRERHRP